MIAKLLQLKLWSRYRQWEFRKNIVWSLKKKKKNWMTGDHRLLFLRDTSTKCSGNVEASVTVP